MIRFSTLLKSTAVFSAGALAAGLLEWLQPVVTVEVTNRSNQTIRSLQLNYSGTGYHEGRITDTLAPGARAVFQWHTPSESSYRLTATFEDGRQVIGGAGYIQRGEIIKDSISESEVHSRLPVRLTLGVIYEEPRNTTLGAKLAKPIGSGD